MPPKPEPDAFLIEQLAEHRSQLLDALKTSPLREISSAAAPFALWHEAARLVLDELVNRLAGNPPNTEAIVPCMATLQASGGALYRLERHLVDQLARLLDRRSVPPGALTRLIQLTRDVVDDALLQCSSKVWGTTLLDHERYLQTLGQMRIAVFRADADSRMMAINEAGAKILGASSPDEIIGRPFAAFYAREEERQQLREELMQHGRVVGHRFAARRLDGKQVWLETNMLALREGNKIIGFQGFGRDVTELVQALEQLRVQEAQHVSELERQVQQRTAELERANEELRHLDRLKDRFLANISHELRNPLVSGLGYVELVLNGGMGEIPTRAQRGLERSLRNLRRLVSLIDDLLRTTREGPAPEQSTAGAFPLRPLVKECVQDLRTAVSRQLNIRVAVDEDLPAIFGERERIRQVFNNLLTNAEKFTRSETRIQISARQLSEHHIEVRIADNGIGIPAEDRERVFDRFYRSPQADADEYRGTGIGLSLVREILEQHGCEARIEPRRGGGTVVLFTLPVAPATSQVTGP